MTLYKAQDALSTRVAELIVFVSLVVALFSVVISLLMDVGTDVGAKIVSTPVLTMEISILLMFFAAKVARPEWVSLVRQDA